MAQMRPVARNITVKPVVPIAYLSAKERAPEEKRVPSSCKEAIVFSDYWRAYQSVIPTEQHRPGGKETWIKMHEICLKLFVHRYNTELLPIVG